MSELAVMLPTRPVTASAADPTSVSAVFSASAVALTVTTSLAPLAVIEVAPEPVVIAMPLSAALPVVTVNAPVKAPAAIFPTRPVTVSTAEPLSVSAVFCASAVALTLRATPLESIMLVAPLPVVTFAMPAAAAFVSNVTLLAPVSRSVCTPLTWAKSPSSSVPAAVIEIVSAPPLPLIAAGAASAAADANPKMSLPDEPSIHAAEAAPVFPATSVAIVVNVWTLESVTGSTVV